MNVVRGTKIWNGVGGILAIVLSASSLKLFPAPWVWIALVWALVFARLFVATARLPVKSVLLTSAFALVALAGYEAYLWRAAIDQLSLRTEYAVKGSAMTGDADERTRMKHARRDDVLGARAIPGAVVSATKRHGETLLYDVVYSIDEDGLRIASPGRSAVPQACVLFFVDSYGFGEGVQDWQTFPYRVGELSSGGYWTYNFGFSGYGPHHMLAALEHGLVTQAVRCTPTHLIYMVVPSHVLRVKGSYTWGRHSPRYRLLEDGTLRREGFLDDNGGIEQDPSWVVTQFKKSYIVQALVKAQPVTDGDLALFSKIVDQSMAVARSLYPGIRTHLILLGADVRRKTELYDRVKSLLKFPGTVVHDVSDILPGYWEKSAQYEISPFDPHLNPYAYDLMARYATDHILSASDKRTQVSHETVLRQP